MKLNVAITFAMAVLLLDLYLVIQRLHRIHATLPALNVRATLSKHCFFRWAPGRLVMLRYQIRFHHSATIAHSLRGKEVLVPARPILLFRHLRITLATLAVLNNI